MISRIAKNKKADVNWFLIMLLMALFVAIVYFVASGKPIKASIKLGDCGSGKGEYCANAIKGNEKSGECPAGYEVSTRTSCSKMKVSGKDVEVKCCFNPEELAG